MKIEINEIECTFGRVFACSSESLTCTAYISAGLISLAGGGGWTFTPNGIDVPDDDSVISLEAAALLIEQAFDKYQAFFERVNSFQEGQHGTQAEA